jgi:hypothetical protein
LKKENMTVILLNISQWHANGKCGMKIQLNNPEPNPETLDEKIGQTLWFEYRFFDSLKSYNPELWFRSHQQVKVVSIEEPGLGKTMADRIENRALRSYKVKFDDGYEHQVSEEELLYSKKDFYTRDDTDNR